MYKSVFNNLKSCDDTDAYIMTAGDAIFANRKYAFENNINRLRNLQYIRLSYRLRKFIDPKKYIDYTKK